MKLYNELPIIKNRDVLLRPITLKDTENILKWRNNPEVSKHFIFRDTLTYNMHLSWLNNKVFTGECIQYIIEELETNVAIGCVYFRDVDYVHKSAEFGIFIGEDAFRSKGIGGKVTKVFKEFGFNILGLRKIFLRVIKNNIRAYRSYIKAGYVFDHCETVRVDGKEENIIFLVSIKFD